MVLEEDNWYDTKKVDASIQTHPLHHLGVTLPFDKNYALQNYKLLVITYGSYRSGS